MGLNLRNFLGEEETLHWLVKFCTNYAYEKGNVGSGNGWNGQGEGRERQGEKQEVRLKEMRLNEWKENDRGNHFVENVRQYHDGWYKERQIKGLVV